MCVTSLHNIVWRHYGRGVSDSAVALLLGCCAFAFAANPSRAAAQAAGTSEQSVSPQAPAPEPKSTATPGPVSQGSQPTSTSSPPLAARAKIYVYENGRQYAGDPLIFVNDTFLAVLSHKSYAEGDIPPGVAAVGMIPLAQGEAQPGSVYRGLAQYLPPALRWPKCAGDPRKPNCTWDTSVQTQVNDDQGCSRVDWQHVDEARPEDLALCKRELSTTSAALENWIDPNRKSKEFLLGMLLPTTLGGGLLGDSISGPKGDLSAWLQMCGPGPFPQRSSEAVEKIRSDLKRGDGSDDWSRCKDKEAAAYLLLIVKGRVRIDAQPGKTYYVRWSWAVSGGKLEVVDEATGAKDVGKLHPTKDR
jgi:hypothetical protein